MQDRHQPDAPGGLIALFEAAGERLAQRILDQIVGLVAIASQRHGIAPQAATDKAFRRLDPPSLTKQTRRRAQPPTGGLDVALSNREGD